MVTIIFIIVVFCEFHNALMRNMMTMYYCFYACVYMRRLTWWKDIYERDFDGNLISKQKSLTRSVHGKRSKVTATVYYFSSDISLFFISYFSAMFSNDDGDGAQFK